VREPFHRAKRGRNLGSQMGADLPVIMIVGLFGGFGTLTEAAALTASARSSWKCLSIAT